MTKYVLIINPISGTLSKEKRMAAVRLRQLIEASGGDLEEHPTLHPGHAGTLAAKAVKDGADVVVVAGGDGTVNEVLPALSESGTSLSIIPFGSGNGIARSLGITMNISQACELAVKGTSMPVDLGMFGDRYFLGVAGVGFDAHIARCFREQTKRGFWKYTQLVMREFRNYELPRVKIESGDQHIESEIMVLTFANANQYGNNFFVDKSARMDDGLLSCVMVPRLPFFRFIAMAWRGFRGTVTASRDCTVYSASRFSLESTGHDAHVDGEPFRFEGRVEVKVIRGGVLVRK